MESSTEGQPGNLKVKEKAKRYQNSDAPLIIWKESYRDKYLDNNISLEGRGRLFNGCCAVCGSEGANFRCTECYGYRMTCKDCVLKQHNDDPLHTIQVWEGRYFQATSLRDLGLHIQLGHRPGHDCEQRVKGHKDFVIIHSNGIHLINVYFCGCPDAPDHVTQLMEVGWWPTSSIDPQSAATNQVLRLFHIMNLRGHIPPTDFYSSLELSVDGTGLQKLPDRQQQFMDVVRQWRHVKMGKRAARGHDPSGLAGTAPGAAAVLCRACPLEGVNIPSDWMSAPADEAWIYNLTLAMDANFKQKARLRPNDAQDPPLGPGFACTVDHETYLPEVLKHTKDQDEISHCVAFSAVYSANTKKSKGLRATGIGSVTCARHEVFRPNGTGDLQKGERQINMDWLFLSAIMFCQLIYVVISYDIACQWAINFYARLFKMPKNLQMPSWRNLRFKVPKFHLPAHKDECHARYGLNFTEGVGKVDAEGPERTWSTTNELARSLSVMTPGGRWDTMDDHCNNSNYRKMSQLDNTLMKRLVKAIAEAITYTRAFNAFHDALMMEHDDLLEQWQRMVEAWEKDPAKPCPYDLPTSNVTMNQVKKRLIEEELLRERQSSGSIGSGKTMSAMIIEGVEIEEVQRNLIADVKVANGTMFQETNFTKRRTTLFRRIRRFREAQVIHIPALRTHVEELDANTDLEPEFIPLLLPSDSYFDNKDRLAIFPLDVISAEAQLREAQAFDALADIRNKLRARTVAAKYKSKMINSQGMWTRQRTLQDVIGRRLQASTETYRIAYRGLLGLNGPGPWMDVLQELHSNDVRGINERLMYDEEKAAYRQAQLNAGVSEGEVDAILNGVYGAPTVPLSSLLIRGESARLPISWIWYSTPSFQGKTNEEVAMKEGASVKEIEASLRVEWCKARARARRAREELILVQEEMRRSLQFCQWRSEWWIRQIGQRSNLPWWLNEGLAAYATEQSSIERMRVDRWAERWGDIRMRAREVQLTLDDTDKTFSSLSKLKEVVIEVEDDS
ncbi:hypothetical protein VNI00_015965 [Paramarasmius palmivorus]|uniref:CxC2-like cysteine cluster KDZ transposase-associated domain-containing protein n=1 Tax=Paramarasmius palmivorus TaxID=297713 RepID=A0AAW0BGP2_9AGAR